MPLAKAIGTSERTVRNLLSGTVPSSRTRHRVMDYRVGDGETCSLEILSRPTEIVPERDDEKEKRQTHHHERDRVEGRTPEQQVRGW